jgi:hypothetical protein
MQMYQQIEVRIKLHKGRLQEELNHYFEVLLVVELTMLS